MDKIIIIIFVLGILLIGSVYGVEQVGPAMQVQPDPGNLLTGLPYYLQYQCWLSTNKYSQINGRTNSYGFYPGFALVPTKRVFSPGGFSGFFDPADPNYNYMNNLLGNTFPASNAVGLDDLCVSNPLNPNNPEIIKVECSNYWTGNVNPNVPAGFVGALKYNANEVTNGQGNLWECQQWAPRVDQPAVPGNPLVYSGVVRIGAYLAPKLTGANRISDTNPIGPAVFLNQGPIPLTPPPTGGGGGGTGSSVGCGGGPGGTTCSQQIQVTVVPAPGTTIQQTFLVGPAPGTTVDASQIQPPCTGTQCTYTFNIPVPVGAGSTTPSLKEVWFVSAVDSNNVINSASITIPV